MAICGRTLCVTSMKGWVVIYQSDRTGDTVGTTAAPAQLGDYATFLRRQWWLIGLIALLGVGLAAAYTSMQPRVYTSVTEVLVTATGADDQSVVANGRTRGEVNLDTEAQLVTSTEVTSLARQLLGEEESGDELANQVRVSVPPNTEVLAIAFTAASPKQARRGAEAIAGAYLANRTDAARAEQAAQRAARDGLLNSLTQSLAEVTGTLADLPPESAERAVAQAQVQSLSTQVSLLEAELSQLDMTPVTPGRIITAATLPKAPSSPVLPVNLAGGAMVGLLLGCGLAVLRHRSDRYVRAPGEVGRRAGLPVLASIPPLTRLDRYGLADATTAAGRSYTKLRNVITAAVSPGQRIILVSAVDGDAGEVTANLVTALARTGGDVVLVSADAASTAVFRLLMTSRIAGLSEVLTGEVQLTSALQAATEPSRLQVLAPGLDPRRAAALLQTQAAAELLATLSATAGYVVVEAPPTSSSGQAQTLAALADVAIVVVHTQLTRTEDILDAVDQFAAMRTPLLGSVVVPGKRVRPWRRLGLFSDATATPVTESTMRQDSSDVPPASVADRTGHGPESASGPDSQRPSTTRGHEFTAKSKQGSSQRSVSVSPR